MATTSATRCARGGIPPLLLAAALGLGACSSVEKYNPWSEGGSTDLAEAPPPAVPNATPDDRGVITYASYQVAVARDGDTLATVATRVGTTPTALASRNALPEDAILHEGQVLVLPNDVPRPAAGLDTGQVTSQPLGWTPGQASAAIDSAPAGAGTAASPTNPFQNGQKEPLIDPVRHRVEEGETAYSIARLYGVSVTALASWNGLGPDLAIRPKQELLIPIVSDANKITTASTTDTQPGQGTPVGAPPSAATPLPKDITAAVEPDSPNLGQYRTPPGGRLAAPVSGKVTRGYNPSSPNGVGFSVPAGTAVHAAAPGEVAMVSEALGGLGTIVLVRHKDDLITTYSTLTDVKVKEGDRVTAGEVLGEVAPREKPELQFDVFRGTTSVDPTPYLGGG
ncbi:MAG: LysM peptidoglycan-binding domain-containing protein [Amaricoccus sp.]